MDVPTSLLDDLLIHITEFDRDYQAYPVQVTLEGGRVFEGWLNLEGLAEPPDGDANAITTYGLDLFHRLFAGPLDNAFQQAWAAARARNRRLRVRLWLDSEDTALHHLPWEMLHYNASGSEARPVPLATDERIAFSRYLTSSEPWGKPIEYRPLRLCILVSAPNDLGDAWPDLAPLDKGAEVRRLEAGLRPMREAGQLGYDVLPHATPEALHALLSQNYDILLYFGHAMHHPRLGTRLVLEDPDTGGALLYDGSELVQRLKQANHRPNLIVFVACNTAAQQHRTAGDPDVQTTAPASLAANLVQQGGVPAVLAMQRLVDITLARTFSQHLSQYLLRHGIVDVAVNSVRHLVYRPDSAGWSTPTLYMRSQDGRLFAPNARLEYAQALYADQRFARWQGDEFIRMEAIMLPHDQSWQLLKFRPQDAPPSSDVLEALRHTLGATPEAQPPTHLVALLGPPRSGQTTTLQRFAWELARDVREHPSPDQPIAIYVSLAGYEQLRGSNRIEQVIMSAITNVMPNLGSDMQRLFREGSAGNTADSAGSGQPRYIFLLDGLDVIAERYRAEAGAEIVALFERLPGQSMLVSCVQDSFPAHIFRSATVLLMLPLSERLVRRYLRQRAPERASLLFRRIVESRLLDMATDPPLLALIYERLTRTSAAVLTRNQLLQEVLDESLSRIAGPYTQGDVARRTIVMLAWEFRWRHADTLPLHDVFALMGAVRRERDYSLETLFRLYCEARLLTEVGQHSVRFAYPALQSYCAALELYNRPDFDARLKDIIAMCGVSSRMEWWEDTLYALAGLIDRAEPLAPLADAAIMEQSSTYTLILARLLQVLSDSAEQGLTDRVRLQLLDICALRLHADREPSIEVRAQIARALGNLNYPKVRDELGRLLTQRVRMTPAGLRHDLPQVRIAAARALHTYLTRQEPPPPPAAEEEEQEQEEEEQRATRARKGPAVLGGDALPQQYVPASEAAPVVEGGLTPALYRLFDAWSAAADSDPKSQQQGRAELRATLLSSSNTHTPLERSLAAFALGDVAADSQDASLMFAMIVRPPPAAVPADEWDDTMWGAAGALTLFDAEIVANLLVRFFASERPVPPRSLQQLAYIAGRARVQDAAVLRWLIELLVEHTDHATKSRALQALAWLSRSLNSLEWLNELLPDLSWLPLKGPVVPMVQQIIQAIAAWDTTILDRFGSFQTQAAPDSFDSVQQSARLGLRRRAIEALALIGDQQTLDDLYPQVPDWPLELREAWHLSAAAIRSRLELVSREMGH
jgi:hypothetical protein